MIRVLVVDDERLARTELRRLLAAHPQCSIVGEAASVAEGLARLSELQPDLLLLNVNMPDGSGYDLLAGLDEPPEVIFTTGYGAAPAECLHKPIRPERLAAALEQAALRIGMGRRPRKVLLRDGERRWFVRLCDIGLFEAEGEQTRAYVEGASPLLDRPLWRLEQLLDRHQFFRASQRHIVNLADVRRIVQTEDGALALNVAGMTVPVAHAVRHAV